MNINEISSIGCLANHDGSIALSVCTFGQMMPVFVTLSQAEFDQEGGLEGFKNNKQRVIHFYEKYGPGRP